MHAIGLLALLVSVITPQRTWVPPAQPLNVTVKSEGDASLVLTDFTGKVIQPGKPCEVSATEKQVDLKEFFPALSQVGTYVLYVVPKGKPTAKFEGTPLLIELRAELRPGAPPAPHVYKVEPLRFAVMTTGKGPMTMALYFDVAPNTADAFLRLSEQGYYDGLLFHRIVPGFVIQGGDPRGDGTGGPGYRLEAEFNDRPHIAGVLSMARQGDPHEGPDSRPRCEYANSAGSQFFVCLDYNQTKALDGKYTAFGIVSDGMNVAQEIAKTPLSDPQNGAPATPQVIQKVEVKLVTAAENPYASMLHLDNSAAATEPAGK